MNDIHVVEIVGSFIVNPREVEYVLQQANFTYPRDKEAERYAGWSSVPVIPKLYNWTAQHQRLPRPDEGVAYLLTIADRGTDQTDTRIVKRGQKLYLDFCREMHTLALLQHSDAFGYVSYQKCLDLRYNVDYVAALLSTLQESQDKVGIQSAMRANWNSDMWSQIKAARRQRRGDAIDWSGPLFWLTNKDRPQAKQISGCWLFGGAHVSDLVDQIRGAGHVALDVAIQTTFWEDR